MLEQLSARKASATQMHPDSGESACITDLRVNLENKVDIKDEQGIFLVCGQLILNQGGPKDYQPNELVAGINQKL